MRLLKNIFLHVIAVMVMMGCTKDSDISSLTEEEKMDKAIETIESFMESVIAQCNEIENLDSYLESINEVEGVEKAWLEEKGLCVKVENGGVLVWLFTPEEISLDESITSFSTRGIIENRDTDSNVKICKNQKVCIINQFSEDPVRKSYIELYDKFKNTLINNYGFWEKEIEIIDAEKLTLDFIANDLPQYGIVFFATHGGFIDGKHWLLTGMGEVEKDKWKIDLIRGFYLTFEDVVDGGKKTVKYVGFNEDFLSEYSTSYPDNSIMFCTACQSFKGNNNLAKIFQDKNLGCFIGYDETNYQGKTLGLDFLNDLIVTNATVSEEFQRTKSRFDAVEIFSTKVAKENHNPAKLMCYPAECNIVLREDIGKIKEYVQTKNPKCVEDSVFFSYNITATYTNFNSNMKEWGIVLYKGEKVNKLYPVSNVVEEKSVDISFYLFKEQLDLDYKNYIATPKEQWFVGVYEKNDKGVILYSRHKQELQMIYDQKPSITLFDLVVGETMDIDEGRWSKRTSYDYKIKATGILFIDEWYRCYSGNWVETGKKETFPLHDANWWWSMEKGVYYNPGKFRDSYIFFEALVDGKVLKSTNYISFDASNGICNISLVDGTVSSKSRNVSDSSNIYGLAVDGLLIRFEW